MATSTNPKNTTKTEEIKCAMRQPLKYQMLECIVFFVCQGDLSVSE